MGKLQLSFLFFIIFTLLCSSSFAEDGDGQVPDQVTIKHWTCKEISELAEKYGAEKRLPDSVVVEGKTCTKSELAECLLSILEKVCDKCGTDSCEAVSREDLDRIAALHDALKAELVKYEGYLERRETIERILARPETPPFLYRAGVNGFLRAEGAGNFRLPDFSFSPERGEGRFLYRIKPYCYWHPSEYLDIHIEGQWYGYAGSNQDLSRFAVYQGFVEARLPGIDWLALKVGRQEYSYGSTFILGPNSFFDGLSFDSARLRLQPLPPLTLDFLGGNYAAPFNNGFKGSLAGGYLTYTFSEGDALDAYALSDTGPVGNVRGTHLDIWGLRGTAALGPVTAEFEPVYESGRITDGSGSTTSNINAYGGHLDLTAGAVTWGYHNKFSVGYAMGSGSKDGADGLTPDREFRHPNNDSSLVGDMSVVGELSGITIGGHHASGLRDYTLGWGIDLTDKLNFTTAGHYFHAIAVEDGFSHDIGAETDFAFTYSISENFSLILEYDHFFTGTFFKDATGSGSNVDYGYAMLQFNLSHSRLKKL
jgi:hypothetical protein